MLPLLTWLIQGAIGPALVGVPVTWGATDLAGAAKRWFRRLRRSDGLSRIAKAAANNVELSDSEFAKIRQFLEDEGTWVAVGRGTVEDLAAQIASCLPGREGESALAAGRAIAGGVLEFAVRDLEPQWFRQVLFARLERMQADQTRALDQAMLSVHVDLAALFAAHDESDEDRFAEIMRQLARVLERAQPDAASRGAVAVYLATLVRWLNTDPWPQDTRFAGPALTPAAIERKLRIVSGSGRGKSERDLDADDLARQCVRLVVLGGPGSGKTWLARRTARLCAEASLDALVAGALPDEVELPLYTTCGRLVSAPQGDSIRRAIVASALGQLPDIGGARVIDALRVLFEERGAPTLLVVDSLDETRGADDRLRQADTLPQAWRIVLTSRPGSWNGQLAVVDDGPARQIGLLQPLRYPGDVEPFITGWFHGRPAWAADLIAQLRARPSLRQAATVPLILAFYCIVGGDQPLPGRRADLYAKVLRRMLTGRWRGDTDCDPDPDACMETLRDWAWAAAASDPVSGVGAWMEEFPTSRVRQTQDDRNAMDHIAVPLGPPNTDTGLTQRRFVHRSLHEHLVAEHVAFRMSAGEAASELLNHLWYDPDWEYVAPAALALHPQRNQILKELICGVIGDDQLPVNLAAIDGCWEIRHFLARIALESGEDAWTPDLAEMIGQARIDLAILRQDSLPQVVSSSWPTSNTLIIKMLLEQLAELTDISMAPELTEAVTRLATTAQERAQVRDGLLGLLARQTNSWMARELAHAIIRLVITAQERALARNAVLAQLAGQTDFGVAMRLAQAVADLDPIEEERTQGCAILLGLLAGRATIRHTGVLAPVIAQFVVTVQERAQARRALLRSLVGLADPGLVKELAAAVAELDPTEEERAQVREALIVELLSCKIAALRPDLVPTIIQFAVAAQERASVCQALLRSLADMSDPWMAQDLAQIIAGLDPTADERAQARQMILALIRPQTSPWLVRHLAEVVARLSVKAQDCADTRQALLSLLTNSSDPEVTYELAHALAGLSPEDDERAQACQDLLARLSRQYSRDLVLAISRLAVTKKERVRARHALLMKLGDRIDPWPARDLVLAITQLVVTSQEKAQTREALLGLLTRQSEPGIALRLARAVVRLDPTADERMEVCRRLPSLLNAPTGPWPDFQLVPLVIELAVTTQERTQTRRTLLKLLTGQADPEVAQELAQTIIALGPTPDEQAQARRTLLAKLACQANHGIALRLAQALVALGPTPDEQTQTRRILLAMLASDTNAATARGLAQTVAGLRPKVADLDGSDDWHLPPTAALLAAARQNSRLPEWLAALPRRSR